MDSKILDSLPCTEQLLELAYSAKCEELTRVCQEYGCSMMQLKMELSRLLRSSNMHLGACNQAIDFLIVAVDKQKANSNLVCAIHDSILASAVVYANIMGKDPVMSNGA